MTYDSKINLLAVIYGLVARSKVANRHLSSIFTATIQTPAHMTASCTLFYLNVSSWNTVQMRLNNNQSINHFIYRLTANRPFSAF